MKFPRAYLFIVTAGCLFLAACAPITTPSSLEDGLERPSEPRPDQTTPADPADSFEDRSDEYSFSQLLPFDAIAPVYDPEFVPAQEAPLQEDELVMGIAINGEAKAYPVSVLRFREIVNDELGELPILVTW
jgi:hypothetical protein